MPAETLSSAANEAVAAKNSVKDAAKSAMDAGRGSLNDAMEHAERSLNEASKRVEKVLREGIEQLKVHSADYRENAGQHFDDASKYVVERVKERPVTATLAGLGVGLLLGMLFASRSSK